MTDKFCHMPWHAITLSANGDIKPCCQFSSGGTPNTQHATIMENFNSERMQDLRRKFLAGEQPTECRSCWEREDQIGHSRRQWFAEKFGKYIPKNRVYDLIELEPEFIQADINLSNVCNLKCRMCGSWASNSWFEEELILANKDKRYQKNRRPQPLQQYELADLNNLLPHLHNIRRIDFKGGEPMMAKHHNDFLQWLIDNDHTDVHLLYTTNGTVQNPKILKLLSAFRNVSLVFSIEGTGTRYSYIRGGKYSLEELETNIAAYSQLPNVKIMFNVTVQNYNLLNLAELREYLTELGDKYPNVDPTAAFTTICNKPDYLSPINVPDEIRDQALKMLFGITDFDTLCGTLQRRTFNPETWQTFLDYTRDLDQLREENILDHCPEFGPYFND